MAFNRIAAGVGVCLLLAAPAFGQTSAGERTGVNSVVGKSPSTEDFVTEVAISDMFEIESSQMAQQKASDDATKAFAAQMITDHQKTTSDLKTLLGTGNINVTPPPVLDKSHQKMLDRLGKLNGAKFTKRYHADQVSVHKSAVSAFRRYAKGGDNAGLKEWAGKTLPALEHHLQMARALDK